MKIEVLYFDGCPNHSQAVERIREVLKEEDTSTDVLEVKVQDASSARAIGFLGSPSIRVNGRDVDQAARYAREYGMMCRTYAVNGRREGLPSRDMIRRAIRDATAEIKVMV